MTELIVQALQAALLMAWQIFWGVNLGFMLSAAIEVAVPKDQVSRLIPDASPRSLGYATLLGAASSSCSYAAVALARTLFRKGADFTAAMVFQFASTNLVLELGILLAVVMGWRFTAAEFAGGFIMIAALALLFRLLLRPAWIEAARHRAGQAANESEAEHPATSQGRADGGILRRLLSRPGLNAVSRIFVMNWRMLWKDVLLGLIIAGAVSAWVPPQVWNTLFVTQHGHLTTIVDVLIGPLVAVLSFTCSIGNVPLAAVLWAGGISFGGVVSFLFADLIILPILDILRKYYGWRMMLFLFGTSYAAMVIAAWSVDLVFGWLRLTPQDHPVPMAGMHFKLNYTSVLDLLLLLMAALLAWRHVRMAEEK